jgi:glucose-1-phosphatase
MDYDLIIFDLGNVTVNFDHNISADKIARRFGLSKKDIYEMFFDSRITQLHDEGRLSPRQFYHKVKKAFRIDIDFGEFKNAWNNIFFANRGMGDLIKKLTKRYRVYLMSNTNKLHFEFIKRKFKIIKKFDRVILSYKIGRRKPHPRIYKYALRLARTSPERTIYIDDRLDLIESARMLGIKSLLFKDISGLRHDLKSLGLKF